MPDRDLFDCEEDHYLYLLSGERFKPSAFKNITEDMLCTTFHKSKMSLKMRKLLQHFGDSDRAREIILLGRIMLHNHPNSEIRGVPHDRNTPLSISSKKGLFATKKIKAMEFVLVSIEAYLASPEEVGRNSRGLILPNIILYKGLKHDFSFFDIVEVKNSRKRKRKVSHSDHQPAVKKGRLDPSARIKNDEYEDEYESIFEKYVMCIDLSMADEKARAIRRTCNPNCVIQYVLIDQRMELFVLTTRDVEEGEELTIEHDFDYYYSSKMLRCAHRYDPHDPCNAEMNRRSTIQRYVDAAGNEPSTSSND